MWIVARVIVTAETLEKYKTVGRGRRSRLSGSLTLPQLMMKEKPRAQSVNKSFDVSRGGPVLRVEPDLVILAPNPLEICTSTGRVRDPAARCAQIQIIR